MSAASSKDDSTRTRHSLDKTNQLIEYVESLVATNEQHASTDSFLVDLIDEKFERLANRLEQQIGELFNSLVSAPNENNLRPAETLLNSETADPDTFSAEPIAEDDDEEALSQLSAWDRQKRELLAEHGQPMEPLRAKVDKKTPVDIPRLNATSQDEDMEALHESIESINNIDAEEIEVLKEQLTSKLRDAEVELSINRAKLSQQWASLEQRQFEIAQREAMFANKYGSLDEPARKQGLLDRLSRHLSRKTVDDNEE